MWHLRRLTTFLISPAEPALIRTLGRTSAIVEHYGADIIFPAPPSGFCGIQRKEYTDLLNSVADDRLHREIVQLEKCSAGKFLIIEGRPQWLAGGELNDKFLGHWKRDAYRALIRSLQTQHGITVEFSDSLTDTLHLIGEIARWMEKADHSSLLRRGGSKLDRWGRADSRETKLHVLQGVDGVGRKTAELLVDAAGGELPLRWTMTTDDMAAIKGIGPKTIEGLTRIIRPWDLDGQVDIAG